MGLLHIVNRNIGVEEVGKNSLLWLMSKQAKHFKKFLLHTDYLKKKYFNFQITQHKKVY